MEPSKEAIEFFRTWIDARMEISIWDTDAIREGLEGCYAIDLQGLVEALKVAQPIVCSMRCPSVKYGPEPWTHHEDCIKANAALASVGEVKP